VDQSSSWAQNNKIELRKFHTPTNKLSRALDSYNNTSLTKKLLTILQSSKYHKQLHFWFLQFFYRTTIYKRWCYVHDRGLAFLSLGMTLRGLTIRCAKDLAIIALYKERLKLHIQKWVVTMTPYSPCCLIFDVLKYFRNGTQGQNLKQATWSSSHHKAPTAWPTQACWKFYLPRTFSLQAKWELFLHKSRCQSLVNHSQGLYQATVCQITSPFLKNWSIFVACLNCFQLVSAFPRRHISQIFQTQFFTIFAGPILCCCNSVCALFSKPICSLHNRIISQSQMVQQQPLQVDLYPRAKLLWSTLFYSGL